jgi:hypothetical protein
MSIRNGSIVYFYNDANALHIAKVSKVVGKQVHLEDCHIKVGEVFITLSQHLKMYKVEIPETFTEQLDKVSLVDGEYLDEAMSIYFPTKEVYNSQRGW